MPKVDVGDSRVAYSKTGSGPGVVLVHGAGATKDTNWGPTIERLEDRYAVVAVDLSGSGETADGGGPIELEDLAAQVLGAAEDAKVAPFHLVGYSMGAVISAAVAASRPDLVRSLVLVAPWTHADARIRHEFDLWRRLFEADRELWVRFAVLAGSGPRFFASADRGQIEGFVEGFLGLTPEGVGRQAEFISRLDVRPLLGGIEAPTLVVGLRHDQQILTKNAREVHAEIGGSEYAEIGSGHLAPWQHPEEFVGAIEGFLVAREETASVSTRAAAHPE